MATKIEELREFVSTVDANLERIFPFTVESVRVSGNPAKPNTYYVRGHAAVFNQWSLDLGGFRERVMPGAFEGVLQRSDLHVLHLVDHDKSKVLSSTRNGTLTLVEDRGGLAYDSEVDGRRSYAADAKLNLELGLVDQASFAFTVGKDVWRLVEEDGAETVERDIVEVDDLFDVTTCAMGAYPTTDSALAVRTLARRTVVPALSTAEGAATVASFTGGKSESHESVGEDERAERARALADLKQRVRARQRAVRERAYVNPKKEGL
jgi:HK97 family phage prohead protease